MKDGLPHDCQGTVNRRVGGVIIFRRFAAICQLYLRVPGSSAAEIRRCYCSDRVMPLVLVVIAEVRFVVLMFPMMRMWVKRSFVRRKPR